MRTSFTDGEDKLLVQIALQFEREGLRVTWAYVARRMKTKRSANELRLRLASLKRIYGNSISGFPPWFFSGLASRRIFATRARSPSSSRASQSLIAPTHAPPPRLDSTPKTPGSACLSEWSGGHVAIVDDAKSSNIAASKAASTAATTTVHSATTKSLDVPAFPSGFFSEAKSFGGATTKSASNSVDTSSLDADPGVRVATAATVKSVSSSATATS
ncbi:hypothetical protein PF005_g33070, partial [Phytophthora fragariae]